MGIKNSKELGENLVIIAKRLLANQNLCKLLVYTDENPLTHPDIPNTKELLHKNILVVPSLGVHENTESRIVLVYESGLIEKTNSEFKNVDLKVLVYVPVAEWLLNSNDLRPFMIVSEIEQSLKDKRMNGVGLLQYSGFTFEALTDEMTCYALSFNINVFD